MNRHTVTNLPGVRKFVRDTLGCGCPEEVFDDLVLSLETPWEGAPEVRTLLVGKRLLVVMLAVRDWDELRAILPQLAGHYRRMRDRCGYNRVRLVAACDRPESLEPAATLSFTGLPEVDARMHLHILTAADLDGVA